MSGNDEMRPTFAPLFPFWLIFCLGCAVVSVFAACEERTVAPNIDPNLELLVAGQVSTDLDILFVIDNTASMGPWRMELGNRFPDMIRNLREAEGGLPNVHIGVVSTDMGAGSQFGLPGCIGDGDNGRLNPVEGSECTQAPCLYIEDVGDPTCIDPDPENCRRKNYATTIENAFGTIINVGGNGCEYIEPLEAMRQALDGDLPENAGFLRPNAALAVVVIADSDDCSVFDEAVLDPTEPPTDPSLGPPGPIRCFGHGVVCDSGDPFAPGTKSGCVANENSQYLTPPSEYVAFLQGLKAEREQPVFFAAIGGDIDPISVIPHPMTTLPTLMPSCSLDPGGPGARDAEPTIRLATVAAEFGENGQFGSLCTDDLQTALEQIATNLNAQLRGTCLVGDLFDNNEALDGIQAGCSVIESDAQGDNATYINSCEDTGDVRPCFDIFEDLDACSATETGLSMVINRDEPPRPGSVVAMACDVKKVEDGYVKTSYYGCSTTDMTRRSPPDWLWFVIGLLVLATRRRPATAWLNGCLEPRR